MSNLAPERNIAALDLMDAAKAFVANLPNPAVTDFSVSIDHSPSEQIDGSEWHTSALIISHRMGHHAVAVELGKCIGGRRQTLKQWKDASFAYRRAFHRQFFHVLARYPVLALIMSAREPTILSQEQGFARELGISGCYRRVESGGKRKVEFGPFINVGDGGPARTLTVSERHAPMAIFTANHLLRVHTFISAAVRERFGCPVPVWMEVWSDKPPNDFTGPYAELMWLLLGGGNAQDKFTWGGVTENRDLEIDLLADNLAGLFNDICQKPVQNQYEGPELQPPVRGTVLWEHLK